MTFFDAMRVLWPCWQPSFCSFLAGLAVGVSVGVSYGSTNGRVGDFSSCVLWGVQDLCGLEKPLVRADPGTCGAVGTACPA